MLAKVSGTTTTSHAGDGAFEVGPPIGVLRIDETLTQVRRVLQAFLQPVRQFVNVVDRAVAHVVMAHSSSRGMWSENIAPSRTEAVQNSTGPNRSTDADDKPRRSVTVSALAPVRTICSVSVAPLSVCSSRLAVPRFIGA